MYQDWSVCRYLFFKFLLAFICDAALTVFSCIVMYAIGTVDLVRPIDEVDRHYDSFTGSEAGHSDVLN